MQTYEHYKESGIDWIGQIPAHWEVEKGKWLFKKEERPVLKHYEVITCFRDGQVTLRKNRREDGFTNSLKEIGYQGILKGDLVIHQMDAFAGAIGVSDSEGKSTPVYSVCTPKMSGVFNYYYSYLLRSMALSGVILSLAKGIRERSTDFRFNDFSNLLYPFPPIHEQEAIANFLDDKTAKIDALVQTKEQQIEKLKELRQAKIHQAVSKGIPCHAELVEASSKTHALSKVEMKDSGVAWIGDIPKHWEVKRLKHIKKTIRNAFVDGPFGSNLKSEHFVENGDVFVIESGSITKGYFISNNFKTITQEHFNTISRSECIEGDLIIAKIGAYYGMCAELPLLLKRSVVSGNSLKLTLNNLIANTQFYIYLLNDIRLNDIYNRLGIVNSSAQPALSLGTLNNLNIIFPPIQEQEQIVAYLDEVTGKIDQAISQKQEQITKLKEYKQSLINDVVTGKVKVC